MQPITFVDFFSGAGGLSLGLCNAGLRPLFAFDFNRHACDTYAANIHDTVLCTDAQGLSPARIRELASLGPGSVDVVAGGPPCQGFSVQRRGASDDPRNDLVVWFFETAVALKPRVILMENVPGLLGKRGKTEMGRAAEILDQGHYAFKTAVVDASRYGVPQRRRRAILLAWSLDRSDPVCHPSETHPTESDVTVRMAIGDMPEPPADFTAHADYANHVRGRISALNQERISHVPPGGGRLDIPEHLQLPCHRADNGHRHLDVYGRMSWDEPAPTLTALFDNFTRGRFGHPDQNRNITAREGARIQSFPDEFHFSGPKKEIARQIGNAVPPLLARRIGESIATAIGGEPSDPSANSPATACNSLPTALTR